MKKAKSALNPLKLDLERYIHPGSAYNLFSREFVHWALRNETIRSFLTWDAVKMGKTPDELVWGTLNRIPGAPGGRDPDEMWDLNEV